MAHDSSMVFLKRIVLHGFKSFAERTEFEFDAGRTVVVGPNGCGKSNILDAVRWVLGEQSARTLRGARMQDVIFAGSRSRQPANFAEVHLTFDNSRRLLACDETEVVVSRLLYRSGESEYRLHGKRCRMKDIRDLFLDTGVGVDAYSVIEQGRVDALLQASPLERREIFEEAAGISRYRVRRAEAQRKLERAQHNLLRVNDVVDELGKRLRSVKLAAGKARSYQEYERRLRELRSSFALAEYHALQQTLAERRSRVEALTAELEARRAELARHDADASELAGALQSLDEGIQQAEERLRALETEQSAIAERLAQGQRRIDELHRTHAQQQERLRHAQDQAQELTLRVAEEERLLEELRRAEAAAGERIAALEAEQSSAAGRFSELRRRLEQARGAAFEAARHGSRLHNEAEMLEQQRQRLEARLGALAARRQQAQAQQAEVTRRQAELAERARQLEAQEGELSEQVRRLEAEQARLEEEARSLEQRLGSLRETRSSILSQLELLEDLERRLEGVAQGARWALQWREGGDAADGSVVGLVADVLRIEAGRVGALQAVLARFEDLVVVRSGYAFLGELARRGEPPGPLGVIALDRLASRVATVSYREAPGFVACAVDWVQCAPEFRPLAEHLLGRVVVVDVLERALALAQGAPDGYVFVTLAGHAADSSGRLMIGGAGGGAGLISRRAQIRQLRQELDETETELERTQRARVRCAEQDAEQRLVRESVLQQLAAVQRQHVDVQTELVRLHDELGRTQREELVLGSESAEAQRALAETQERARQIDLERQVLAETQRRHEAQLAAVEEELHRLEAAASDFARALTAAQVEVGRAAERRNAREQALRALRARLAELRQEGEQAELAAAEARQRIAQAEQEQRATLARQAALADACMRQRQEALRLREQRQEVRQRGEECGAAVRRLHGEIQQTEAALRECEVGLREVEVRREGLVARMADELRLDLVALYASYQHSEQDWDAIRSEIEELRGRIARLGNVNLDALAELEELTPRYDNLVAQRDDLLTSVARLERLIVELDEVSRTRFLSCFEEVRENFRGLFRKLFGGGRADIVLENPQAPLECGIEIIARPPGKEPQSISLLSGGEKTMTAVALLLAVFQRKPSPFAILDEVDAALDESNIDRFNSVLDEFAARSQFVLITHNKRTMQCADVLYGLTMEEAGVSKRVSVRFEQRVDTPHVA